MGPGRRGRACGTGDRQVDVSSDGEPAVRAEAVLAAVDRGASGAGGDAGLVQDRHGPTFFQGGLQRDQLGVDLAECVQLRHHQRVVALPEAVQGEDQAAEVAVGELTSPAQKAGATANTPARAETG